MLNKNETAKLLTEIIWGQMMLHSVVYTYLFHCKNSDESCDIRWICEGEHRMPAPQPHDKILIFPQAATNPWIENYYHAELSGKNEATIDAYLRVLRQLTAWVAQLPGSEGNFHPRFLTKTAFGDYLEELMDREYSASHLVLAFLSDFLQHNQATQFTRFSGPLSNSIIPYRNVY